MEWNELYFGKDPGIMGTWSHRTGNNIQLIGSKQRMNGEVVKCFRSR